MTILNIFYIMIIAKHIQIINPYIIHDSINEKNPTNKIFIVKSNWIKVEKAFQLNSN